MTLMIHSRDGKIIKVKWHPTTDTEMLSSLAGN
jgi:hypothetical protein